MRERELASVRHGPTRKLLDDDAAEVKQKKMSRRTIGTDCETGVLGVKV